MERRSKELIKKIKEGKINPATAINYSIRYAAENGMVEAVFFCLEMKG